MRKIDNATPSYGIVEALVAKTTAKTRDEIDDTRFLIDLIMELTGIRYFSFRPGKRCVIDGYVVDVENDIEDDTNWGCTVIQCSPGAVLYVTGCGDEDSPLWCFLNSNGTVLSRQARPDDDEVAFDYNVEITAPSGAATLVCNTKLNYNHAILTAAIPQILGILTRHSSSSNS